MGTTFDDYINALPQEMRESLSVSTKRIYDRCHFDQSSRDNFDETQIVVGEVQSGKTASFTGLAAFARDEGVPIVVIIAGTKKNLVNQTKDRLEKDLSIGYGAGLPSWEIVDKPNKRKASQYIELIGKWLEPGRPLEFKTTLLLTVLKSRAGIDHAAAFLNEISQYANMADTPVLIIDDEADQSGLNSKVNKGDQSAIYAAILRLKDSVPRHAYCMYTATPQANFLIDVVDELSPSRVTVLEAGSDYLGGEILFSNYSKFVVPIPDAELNVATDPNFGDAPPLSLKRSIAYFLIALAFSQKRGAPKPLSMLIHPSGKQVHHQIYARWVTEIIASWKLILGEPEDETYQHTIQAIFASAVNELHTTLPIEKNPFGDDFDAIINYVKFMIPLVRIQIENGNSPDKSLQPGDWGKAPGWIVIGGNKLDRGFTVQNLAVTYMPRNASSNADTLQQRGRFFGYKKSYSELLRGWFSNDTEEMFTDYVVHETLMRSHLRELDESDTDVRMWRRKFVLPNALNPTRAQVVAILTNEWHLGQGFVFTQRRLFDSSVSTGYFDSYSLIEELHKNSQPVSSDTRQGKKNYYVECPAIAILSVLKEWVAHPEERKILSDLALTLENFDKNRELIAHIYFMDNLEVRERSVSYDNDPNLPKSDWTIGNLFAGKQHSGAMYIGDTAMKSDTGITVQIHKIHPRDTSPGHVALAVAIAGGRDLDYKVIEEIGN